MTIRRSLVVAALALATALSSCAVAGVETAGGRVDSAIPASPTPDITSATPGPADTPSDSPSPTPSLVDPTPAPSETSQPPSTTAPPRTTAKPATTSKRPTSAPSSSKSTAIPDATLPVAPAGGAGPVGPVDCSVAKCVALTFDDGPNSSTTQQVVDALNRAQAPATFFMLSSMAQANPGMVARIAANPRFEIGSHTVNHPDLNKLGASAISYQINTSASILRSLSGRKISVFRPPYGSHNATSDAGCRAVGQSIIIWDVDTLDWQNRNAAITTSNAVNKARAGSIILMHDIHPSTAAAVPGIIAGLRAKGYTLVTVSQLFGGTTPGKTYFRRG